MNLTQSPHVPPSGSRPSWRDLRWLIPFAARGLYELIVARIIFSRFQASDLRVRNGNAKRKANNRSRSPAELARIAYVIPRISDRLPWRSDCLIQAMAAQNWLTSLGLHSEIQIGVEHPEGGDFGAHAWLIHDSAIITGGDISQYEVLLADSRNTDDSAPKMPFDDPS